MTFTIDDWYEVKGKVFHSLDVVCVGAACVVYGEGEVFLG